MRLLITFGLAALNFWALTTLFPDLSPPMAAFLGIILAVLQMVVILIPAGKWLGISDYDNSTSGWDGGGDQ